ncbi:hypothetical protein [Enterovirga sp.]|uniref:hypothetical protein n=1 Tax=Enterovirga sp. TaxID=2026350 RepID=UPI002C5B4C88|nr:hypothetical protein [Enterovirga sp.]HMO28792.1 hypothetical protein [Enterovirga sp.]
MLTALRLPFRRFVVRHRLHEMAYLSSDREIRAVLGGALDEVCRRSILSGWSSRTAAGILGAIWIGRLARSLDHDRRMWLGEQILAQERARYTSLDWLAEFDSDRMNVVGMDVFLLRFNFASGTLASWIAEGKAVDPDVRRIFLAMAAWGLAGMPEQEAEQRFYDLLAELED